MEPGPRDTGKNKRPKPDIVDILKNYMANKSFSRGIEQVTAEASLAFVGNTSHDVSYMINQSDLFEDLPAVYHDSAFIDRIHAYIPGWEVDIIRGGVLGTYSGLMKIIFPGKDATAEEEAKILEFAMELRKRVKDQLYRIDETFARTHFRFLQKAGAWRGVTTLEEVNFPRTYHSRDKVPLDEGAAPAEEPTDSASALASQQASPGALASENATPVQPEPAEDKPSGPFVGHKEFRENQRGLSYERLFGPYLESVERVEIIDPYIRKFYQCRNLMEALEVILSHFDYSIPEVKVHLTTVRDDEYADVKQDDYLQQIAEAMDPMGLAFTYDYDETRTIHDRKMVINDTWEILLGRGLDIWQYFDAGNAFSVEANVPEVRKVKEFSITYLKK